MGVKGLPSEIVADLDPSKLVNIANFIISKSPKFINLGLLSFDGTSKPIISFAPSTKDKSLNSMQREKNKSEWLTSRHDFERVSKTTSCSNHIQNYELETREVFEQKTENIPLTQQTVLVNPLHDNTLTQSTDNKKNYEINEPEVNPDTEPSLSDSSSKTSSSDSRFKRKYEKKMKRRKNNKYDLSDLFSRNDSDD